MSGDGSGLNQNLVCASDSYKFELKSDVLAKNGRSPEHGARSAEMLAAALRDARVIANSMLS